MPVSSMAQSVVVGVDTHKDTHLGVAKDEVGRHLGSLVIQASPGGYRDLLTWAEELGIVASPFVKGRGR